MTDLSSLTSAIHGSDFTLAVSGTTTTHRKVALSDPDHGSCSDQEFVTGADVVSVTVGIKFLQRQSVL